MDDILSTSEEKTWHYHWFWKIFTTFFRWPKWTIMFSLQFPQFNSNITNIPLSNTKQWTYFLEKFPLAWWQSRYLLPCVSICGNDRWCSSKWKYGCILINFLSNLTWSWFYGDNVSENKWFTLDKHLGLKYAPFIPINEQCTAITLWFKNAWFITHCCSNDLFRKKNQFLYMLL